MKFTLKQQQENGSVLNGCFPAGCDQLFSTGKKIAQK